MDGREPLCAACEDLLHLVGIASFQYSNIRGYLKLTLISNVKELVNTPLTTQKMLVYYGYEIECWVSVTSRTIRFKTL